MACSNIRIIRSLCHSNYSCTKFYIRFSHNACIHTYIHTYIHAQSPATHNKSWALQQAVAVPPPFTALPARQSSPPNEALSRNTSWIMSGTNKTSYIDEYHPSLNHHNELIIITIPTSNSHSQGQTKIPLWHLQLS